jgi:serine/threonine protein kinase
MAEFLKNFDFARQGGEFKLKFFDLRLSKTLDENGFASTSDSETPFYSSPEQLRGGFSTANSDMWSIGVIYYQLLTGKLPFIGPTRELLIE